MATPSDLDYFAVYGAIERASAQGRPTLVELVHRLARDGIEMELTPGEAAGTVAGFSMLNRQSGIRLSGTQLGLSLRDLLKHVDLSPAPVEPVVVKRRSRRMPLLFQRNRQEEEGANENENGA